MRVTYYVEDGRFDLEGDLRSERRSEIIGDFLRTQIGKGKDESPITERDEYNIELRWFPENDGIEVSSNTGNELLRDSILFKILEELK